MTDRSPRRKRRKAAPAGRVLATGLSASAMFGMIAAMAAEKPSWAPTETVGAGDVAPTSAPAPTVRATTIVTRIEKRVIDAEANTTPAPTPAPAPAGAAPAPQAAPAPAGATEAPPPNPAPTTTVAPAPAPTTTVAPAPTTTAPPAPTTTAPPKPTCSGSKC